VQPPLYNYKYVEQPRRQLEWQQWIKEPYVRLFGYTREPALDQNGQPTIYLKEKTPMQVAGNAQLSSRFGYTWRGLRREHDREHHISGGEILIYDLQTKDVLAIRRQFLLARGNPRGTEKAMWEVAASCVKYPSDGLFSEFTKFSFDVLHTVEPSTIGRK
jgi:hypothetical protein